MTAFNYSRLVAMGSSMAVLALAGISDAGTVVVNPANMNGWTLNSFDNNGAIVNSGPYYSASTQMVFGPATPPLGVGSAQLATPVGAADGAAAIATEQFDNTPLASITALNYYAYDQVNNGQQFPYLALSINTGAVDLSGDPGGMPLANTTDTLFFEPPYQTPSTGNPSLPNQGATVQNVWQKWDASIGGWWDNDGIGNPGAGGVVPLSTFITDFPDATIQNGGLPGLGGIAMQVGFESAGDTEVGNVDAFTIGIAGVNTTYDFEPVPEPGSISVLLCGGAGLLMRRRRRVA
jgi:hypothetical protein